MCPVPPLFPAKSSTAAAIAHHYGGAFLSVDAVVTDVLINGTSPVSLTARQLYDCAAAEYAEKKAEEAGNILCMQCKPFYSKFSHGVFVFVYLFGELQ